LRFSNLKASIHATQEQLAELAAKKLRVPKAELCGLTIVKKSIDSRDKGGIVAVYAVEFSAKRAERLLRHRDVVAAPADAYDPAVLPRGLVLHRPVVVGAGPAGLFAALVLAARGLAPIVLERGKPAPERAKDVENFLANRVLLADSNIQFGEGGAGTFSDGKLTTGIRDTRIGFVLRTLVECGAPPEILYLAKPHIGTDKLVDVVGNLRARSEALGARFIFGAKLCGIETADGGLTHVCYADGGGLRRLAASAMITAIGHSARDTVEMLQHSGVNMSPKPFAVGVRIEHLQSDIDAAQYGKFAGDPALGAACYKLSHRLPCGRGVYTFCMCPGGVVVGASSEPGGVVTNGMSYYRRDQQNANSALLVSVSPSDFCADPSAPPNPLDGISFQRELERRAFALGGANYNAPVQTVADFLSGRPSTAPGGVTPSYRPGITPANLADCLPPFVTEALRGGLRAMGKKIAGFDAPGAILTAVESRSSSPVTITRCPSSLQSNIGGIYPCGEGAGYAGGIRSAAIDGIRAAEKV